MVFSAAETSPLPEALKKLEEAVKLAPEMDGCTSCSGRPIAGEACREKPKSRSNSGPANLLVVSS